MELKRESRMPPGTRDIATRVHHAHSAGPDFHRDFQCRANNCWMRRPGRDVAVFACPSQEAAATVVRQNLGNAGYMAEEKAAAKRRAHRVMAPVDQSMPWATIWLFKRRTFRAPSASDGRSPVCTHPRRGPTLDARPPADAPRTMDATAKCLLKDRGADAYSRATNSRTTSSFANSTTSTAKTLPAPLDERKPSTRPSMGTAAVVDRRRE